MLFLYREQYLKGVKKKQSQFSSKDMSVLNIHHSIISITIKKLSHMLL